MVCSSGACVACSDGVACSATGRPCREAKISCATGKAVCTETGNVAQEEAVVAQALPVVRAGHDELRTLRPPQELQDAYDRWLDVSDREVKAIEQLADALKQNDFNGAVSALKDLSGTNVAQQQADAGELGLTACDRSA